MAKKSFKGISPDNPALAYMSDTGYNDDIQDVQRKDDIQHIDGKDSVYAVRDKDAVQRIDDIQDVQPADKPAKYCNINLRLRKDLKDYLGDASWRTRTTMTQYISDLIEADMNKTQEG